MCVCEREREREIVYVCLRERLFIYFYFAVGKAGQNSLLEFGSNLDSAKSTFTKK